MILVDANLLIYAVNRDAPQHETARAWWEATLSGTTRVGLPWMVLLAFLRLTTHPRVMRTPAPPDRALRYVDQWLRQPYVTALGPGERHWSILRGLLEHCGAAGNLTNDAHLAAIAIEHACCLYSADNDFKRFDAIQHVNPLARTTHENTATY